MIRGFEPGWSTAWRRASSTFSTATAGRRPLRWPRAEARLPGAFLLALALSSCGAYLNTFYNAERAFDEGMRLKAATGDSLDPAARAAFETSAEKSAIVLSRYEDSRYADDALFLLARSFEELGRADDAAAAYGRFVSRFPDSEFTPRARLGRARSERRVGDHAAALAALEPLSSGDVGDVSPAEIVFERALIELGRGDHQAAAATFRDLLERFPDYAREENVALRFADAVLAAGEVELALEGYAVVRRQIDDPEIRREVALKAARALIAVGRHGEALEAQDALLAQGVPDSVAAEIQADRGQLLGAAGRWNDAREAWLRAAELAPGTPAASRATLHRGRALWLIDDDREAALDVLLDAFLHAPGSAYGDSARTEARRLGRLIHYAGIVAGDGPRVDLDGPDLVRATALYRLAEEVLDAEEDRREAAALFERLADTYPESPWRPRALLSAGLLRIRAGETAAGEAILRTLIEAHPDRPAADSARRQLGLPVPERDEGFYDTEPILHSLASALPRARDPMIRVANQLDRYARREGEEGRRTVGDALEPGRGPDRPEPEEPGVGVPGPREPGGVEPAEPEPGDRLPAGAEP